MTGSDLALATHGLRKSYGWRLALDGLDLRVPTGVVYGFLGPNGAGNTTTIRGGRVQRASRDHRLRSTRCRASAGAGAPRAVSAPLRP